MCSQLSCLHHFCFHYFQPHLQRIYYKCIEMCRLSKKDRAKRFKLSSLKHNLHILTHYFWVSFFALSATRSADAQQFKYGLDLMYCYNVGHSLVCRKTVFVVLLCIFRIHVPIFTFTYFQLCLISNFYLTLVNFIWKCGVDLSLIQNSA